MFFIFYAVVQPMNLTDINCDIPDLTGDNYKIWKERILLQLGWMDMDYAIRKDEPDYDALQHVTLARFTIYDITIALDWSTAGRYCRS